MKNILSLSLILLSLLFSSCNKHQYVFFESEQDLGDPGDFLVKNDSLEIRYNFSGENLPVKIIVENKSANPVYIDWKRSAAIIDGKKYNYWNDDSEVSLSGLSNVYFYADGEIKKSERITFIPPRSYIETTRMFLQTTLFVQLPENQLQRIRMRSENGLVSVKQYQFTEENSPLVFRSLLTFSGEESFARQTFLESSFRVSEIIESPDRTLFVNQVNDENRLRSLHNPSLISTKTGFGKAAGTVTLLGISTGLLFLAAENDGE